MKKIYCPICKNETKYIGLNIFTCFKCDELYKIMGEKEYSEDEIQRKIMDALILSNDD